MADNNSIKIAFEGDATALEKTLRDVFKKVETGAQGAGKGVDKMSESIASFDKIAGTTFGGAIDQVKSLGGSFGKMLPVLGAVAIAAYGLKEAFEFAQIGEENAKIAKQFETLSSQAGIFADDLKTGLEEAAGGLYDTDDLLKIANGSIVKLGASAAALPQLFELAQKSTKVFGGEATQNLELISNAIGNLQTRSLKQIGINVDAEKTFKDYAKSIGTTSEQLTEAEKKQALLNAVMSAGNERFKGVASAASDPTISNGLKRLATGYDNLKDAIAAIAYSALGKAFASALNVTGEALGSIADKLERLSGKPQGLSKEYDNLALQLARYQELQKLNPNTAQQYDAEIARIKDLMAQKQQQIALEKQSKEFQKQTQEANLNPTERPQTEEQIKKEQDTQQRIAEIKAEANANEQKAALEHKVALDEINGTNADFEAKEQAKIDYKNQLGEIEYQQALIKNSKIKDARERDAADALALQKKTIAEQKTLDDADLARKKSIGDAKAKIEENLWATGFALAKEGSEAQKVLQVAQAIRNTYQGATLALATYPPPFGAIAAATTVGLGLAQVAKITGANDGALVTGGQTGVDSQPFLLSKGEVVAPAKSFDEVVEGTARQRGFTKGGEGGGNDETNSLLSEIKGLLAEVASKPQFVVNGDVLSDQIWIARLAESLRDAVQFRGAQLS